MTCILLYTTGEIIHILAKYFTYSGYIDYISDNITKLKYINGFAQYTMVKIPMTEVIKELTILELQKRIRRLENIVCLRLKSKNNDEAIAVIKTIYNLVIGYDDISGEYEFDDNVDNEAKESDDESDVDESEVDECGDVVVPAKVTKPIQKHVKSIVKQLEEKPQILTK